MTHGFNIGAIIKAILGKMLGSAIPLIFCTDSKSFYNCLIKLGTTQEKQLMVDMMSICQSYKRREITKINWIYGHHNPSDSIIKAKPSSTLKMLIDSNHINITTTEWIEWANTKPANTGI